MHANSISKDGCLFACLFVLSISSVAQLLNLDCLPVAHPVEFNLHSILFFFFSVLLRISLY